jgi:hypothetical protein
LRGSRRGPARRSLVWQHAIVAPTSQTWPIIRSLCAAAALHLHCDPTALKTDPLKNHAVNVPIMTFANIQVGGSNFELCPGALPKFTTNKGFNSNP